MTRAALEAEWLHLTRVTLPALAAERGWPVVADHCFQRILLDNACGRTWYEAIPNRPAYAHAPEGTLEAAVSLGHATITGEADLRDLNHRSLHWRSKR